MSEAKTYTPLAVDVAGAACLTSISERVLLEHVEADKIPYFKEGRSLLFNVRALQEWKMMNSPVLITSRPWGTTYFIQCNLGGPIKIGWTGRTPEERLKDLQSASPWPLTIIGTIQRDVEKDLHLRFAHLRTHHEWFRNESELLRLLKNHQDVVYTPHPNVHRSPNE